MLDKINIQEIINIARHAGKEIMDIYMREYSIETKSDDSPLTLADKNSNHVIISSLKTIYPDIPFISEETKQTAFDERKNWEYFWLIDPLDGTKEFIKKNDEFTVNIALVRKNNPVLGVVYVPAKHILYYAIAGRGAYKLEGNKKAQKIQSKNLTSKDKIVIIGSRSHSNKELNDFVEEKKKEYKEVEFIAAGSALKITYVAEGKADIYPRFGPTMEWDTAAGHIVALEAGKNVVQYGSDQQLTYNKENLLNPFFIVK